MKNRLAEVGDELIVHRFGSGSKGLADANRPQIFAGKGGFFKRVMSVLRDSKKEECAVCVPPGAKLVISGMPKYLRDKYGLGMEETVTFNQFDFRENSYRDGVVFGNGAKVRLQGFDPGIKFRVLSVKLTEERQVAEEFASAR